MRKQIILVLLVPILALTLISCEPEMRTNFANFLGGLGGNVYSGLVKPDYSGVEEADDAIKNLGSVTTSADEGETTVKPGTFGVEVVITVGEGGSLSTLGVQDDDHQTALKTKLKNATDTDDKKEKFAEDQKKPASTEQQQAASGTVQVINATIDVLKNDTTKPVVVRELLDAFTLPDLDDVEELTQADVLVLQLMTDMISNVLNAVDSTTGNFKDGVNQESLINDALFAIDIAETLSGASTIDFSATISLSSLIPKSNGGSSSLAMVPIDDDKGILHGLRGLFPHIISLMGIKRSGNTYTYSSAAYKQFIINQRSYRASWEQASWIAENGHSMKGKTRFSEDTLIKYILAVLITENHEFLKSIPSANSGNAVIADFLTANPGFGDAPTNSNKITSFEDGAVGNIYSETNLDIFLERIGKAKVRRIIATVKAINDNIDEKYRIEIIEEELENILTILDDSTTTDANWFDEVFGDYMN